MEPFARSFPSVRLPRPCRRSRGVSAFKLRAWFRELAPTYRKPPYLSPAENHHLRPTPFLSANPGRFFFSRETLSTPGLDNYCPDLVWTKVLADVVLAHDGLDFPLLCRFSPLLPCLPNVLKRILLEF